ncbi:hypothetical protein CP533_2992 [Ophiocordyceps camponoti-saundersi (nom. inval.)]|nr:hypothetical protein CP533_2992 [Ophiocordyceps camponoti-saundersi (nom. inval.)]
MEDSVDSSLTGPMARIDLNKPRVFSRIFLERFDQNTPRRPYITFTTTPGKLQQYGHMIKASWCNPDLVDAADDYANSSTSFAFGPVRTAATAVERQISDQDLYSFQSNVRGSKSLQCHTNAWKIGLPTEADDDDDTSKFVESLAQAPGRDIGVFPRAQYPGWINYVWKMEVQIEHCDNNDDWQTGCHDEITLRHSSRHLATRRLVSREEANGLIRSFDAARVTMAQLEEAIEATPLDKSEEATANARRLIDVASLDHPNRPLWLMSLANALAARYLDGFAMEDLNQAISITRQAIAAFPPGHPSESQKWRNNTFGNLASHLMYRYERTGAMEDIEETIDMLRESIAVNPRDYPDRPRLLRVLGEALHLRFSRLGAMEDLEEAITVSREAIATAALDNRVRTFALACLEQHLAAYYDRTNDMDALEEAISLTEETMASLPADDLDRSRIYTHLGDHLDKRFLRTGAIEDREQSTECFHCALQCAKGAEFGISAARRLLSRPDVLRRGPQSLEDAKTAIALLEDSFFGGSSAADKKVFLSQASGIASNAAAVALHFGLGPLNGIRVLDACRGILATYTNHLRADISELRKRHPQLADAFETVRRCLDAPSTHTSTYGEPVNSLFVSSSIDQRHFQSRQLRNLTQEIRKKDGFDRFLAKLRDEEFYYAAAAGPIIVLNTSVHGCDALIVEASRIRELHLPNLTYEGIRNRLKDVQTVGTLEWLWDDIVEPILEALGFTDIPSGEWPHVWWVPTGPLTRFPLHAAGYHLESNRAALDRVVSSYGSSLTTIFRTRQRQIYDSKAKIDGSVVVISMKETPRLNPLIYTDDEVGAVRAICTSAPLNLSVISPQPYLEETVSALKTCGIFHFAGHGQADIDPLQSCLCLEDWEDRPLTVAGLIETDLSSTLPFLAYLSACGTGKNAEDNSADESLHLTNMFQLAGFRHAIGTLWEVDDYLSVNMARIVYESLGANGLSDASVSMALHQAIRTLRKEWLCEEIKEVWNRDVIISGTKESKAPLWVPYVHFGV